MDWQPVLLTLKLAFTTVCLLLVVSFPLSWWLANTRSRWRAIVESVTALPLVLPPTVLGFYLLILLGANGALGKWWINMTGQPMAFSFSGLLIASCVYSLPFVVQPLQAAFEGLDRNQMEASCTLGAPPWRTWLQVILPQCQRGLLVAVVLGFAHTVGEFGVVLMVGGNIPGSTQVVSIAIYEHVEALDYQAAHQLSLMLLVFSFAVLFTVYSANRQWQKKPI